jgi:hypothetical protein
MRRLLVTVIGCIILGYELVVVAAFADLPTALIATP